MVSTDFEKRKEAASIFNQMRLVLKILHDDLHHRGTYLGQERKKCP